ncbi:MAG: polysaccharide pyruvyl transferase family protein [Oscillibacter sp.]|nr:polysaccharide pyruvyl transferase family protein [Oscillibacter sp.]
MGYNGAGNTGSDVRTVSIARQVNALFGKESVRMTVMTLDANSLEGCFDENVTLLPFSSIFPLDLYRACSSHHAAILCEGSALKSGFANALTLFLCEAAGVMSAQGKPCIAYGVEAGYMEPFVERAAAGLCRDAYFIARTDESLMRLKKLGLRGHTGTDAAWNYDKAIRPDEADLLLRKQGWDGETPLLGVAVINPFCWPVRPSLWRWAKGMISGDLTAQYDKWYFFSDSPARRNAFRQYIEEVAAGVCSFTRQYDYFPVLIGMERLDERAVRALAGKLNCPKAAFLSGEYPAQAITGILRSLSMLVTSRYHAAVLSMETGCPIVAVSMDERLDGLMRELSLDSKYLFGVEDGNLGGKIAAALSEARAEQDAISLHMRRYAADCREKLDTMGKFMKRYLQDALRQYV